MNTNTKPYSAILCSIVFVLLLNSCGRNPEKAKEKYNAAGRNDLKKGQYGDAAVEFRNAIRLDPRSVEAYLLLAQADLGQRNYNGAYAALSKAIELDPNQWDAHLQLGHLYLAARDFDKAVAEANELKNGKAKDPAEEKKKDAGAYQLLGAAQIGQRKLEDAESSFSQVIQLRPDDPSAYVNRALVDVGLSKYNAAEQDLQKAVSINAQSAVPYIDLANFYRLRNRPEEAQRALQTGITKVPNEPLLYIEWASMLTSQGKEDDAKRILDKLRMQLPNSPDAAIAIGDFYHERKRPDEALCEYQRAISLSPTDVNVKKRIEDLYLSTGQMQAAVGLDLELMKHQGKDTFVQINHGRLLMAQRKNSEAILYLQKVVADAANSPQALFYLAMAHWQNGDISQAHVALLDALKVAPEAPYILQALAQLGFAQGDPGAAVLFGRELVHNFPADSGFRELLAEALARQENFLQADEQILVARQLAPNDPGVHLTSARIYFIEKKWTESQKEFETVLQLDPHDTTALTDYSVFLDTREQPDRALARVQLYVASNPNDLNGHILLGALNLRAKNYAAAQSEFARAVQVDPLNDSAYFSLGQVYAAEGQTDLAVASYLKALELRPQSASIPTAIGNLYLDHDDLVNAEKYYQKALEIDPNHAVALANIAWVDSLEGKDLDVALSMAQKAKSEMPDAPTVTDTLGWVMYKKGDYAGAIRMLQECITKKPDIAEFHYHLGMALFAAGRKAIGAGELQIALQLKQLNAREVEEIRQTLAER